jgi:superfamily II DNA or RNA helicase
MTSLTPYAWQLEPIERIAAAVAAKQSILDGSDLGTGKTVHALMGINKAGQMPAVVCPKSVIPQWQEHSTRIGTTPLFVSNIEALKASGRNWLQTNGRDWRWTVPQGTILVFDEVQRFSAPNSDNAKILAVAPRPVVMLSATAADSPVKLRAIGHQLGLTSWSDWYRWCGTMGCQRGQFGGVEFLGNPEIIDRLHRQIYHTGRGVRVRIRDLPDYPANRIETLAVPVPDQAALDQAYAEAIRLQQDEAPNALTWMLRARQLAEHQKLPPVIDLIGDLLEERAVVVFVNFRDSLARLAKQFPDCATIHGDQNETERQEAFDLFQGNHRRLLIAMIQAGGEGLNLGDTTGIRPRVSVLFPGWSARELKQALGRIHRANSKSSAHQILVFASGTVEERVRKAVMAKAHRIEMLNDGDLSPDGAA